jgi:hypothetical protein
LLAAVMSAERRRPGVAGVLIALGAMVKVTALLGLVTITIWQWKRNRQAAVMTLAATAVTFVAGHGGLSFGEVTAARANARRLSRASPWSFVSGSVGFRTTAAVAVTILLVAFVAYRGRRARRLEPMTAAAVASYGATAAYVLPWYAGWWLPLGLSEPAGMQARFFTAWAAIVLALYEMPRHLSHFSASLSNVANMVVAGGGLVAFLVFAIPHGEDAGTPSHPARAARRD